MKFILLSALLCLAAAQVQKAGKTEKAVDTPAEEVEERLRPRIFRRLIPADVLRDFPNYCFASTSCKLYEDGQDWTLAPFCGRSHCMFNRRESRFFEVVFDCGPKPENPKECEVIKTGNKTDSFPACCDVYDLKTCTFPLPADGAPPPPPPEAIEGALPGGPPVEASRRRRVTTISPNAEV